MGVLSVWCLIFSLMWNPNIVVSNMEDASDVTWAHAVNSRSALIMELAGHVDFLEADVSLGHVIGYPQDILIPIMAHPPDTVSDISLADWIDLVTSHNSSKSVKLDFKSLEVVELSLQLLQTRSNEMNFTLWLNADTLVGPINPTIIPVDGSIFLKLCNQYFPKAVISVGWTTHWVPTSSSAWHYEWKQVRKMADLIRCFGYEHNFPTFTFPVRAIFASRSVKKLQWLLGTISSSTLSVWSDKHDPLLLQDLMHIRNSFPKNKVYYDIPTRLQKSFLKVKGANSYVPRQQKSFNDDQWITLTHGTDHSCSSNTYISNNTVVFGSFLPTATLLKKLLLVDGSHSLKAIGKINFFSDYDELFSIGSHNLSIVITDVSLFSRNFSKTDQNGLDLSGSDTDVIWNALNSSHLYTFSHDFSKHPSGCRIFKIDTSADHSFQAWNVPCDILDEHTSFKELAAIGKQEISSRKRIVLPKSPFMIGFVSSGNGHSVVYDFEVLDKKEQISSAFSVFRPSLSCAILISLSIMLGYLAKRYIC